MKVELLDATHPEYNAVELEQHTALYEGGARWRALIATWVPQNHKEPADLWRERKDRALYFNHVAPITDLFGSWLFSVPPKVDGGDERWADFLKDVDGRGTSWSTWWRERFLDALKGRRAYAWVNLPARDGVEVANRADEEADGLLDPRLVQWDALEVRDWEEDENGALKWVLAKHVETKRDGIDTVRTKTWRWTYVDAEVIRRWEWRPSAGLTTPTNESMAVELPVVQHGFGRMPVVRLQLAVGMWLLRKMRDPAVAHIRARTGLTWALHKTAHAMPVIKTKMGDAEIAVGTGYYLRLHPEDELEWAAPPGDTFEILRNDLSDIKEEIYRVVHQLAAAADSDSNKRALSGASKAADWQATEIVLSAYADAVLSAMRETVDVISDVRSTEAPQVQGLDGWQQAELDALLEAVILGMPIVKSPTWKKEAAKRIADRTLPDVSEEKRDAIHEEIEGADYENDLYEPPPPVKQPPPTE